MEGFVHGYLVRDFARLPQLTILSNLTVGVSGGKRLVMEIVGDGMLAMQHLRSEQCRCLDKPGNARFVALMNGSFCTCTVIVLDSGY